MTTPESRRPTIRDVAAAAGVSYGTVSRVLNGGRWVSAETEAAVHDAIRRTSYRVNPHARTLATNRSNSIGFLLTESQQLLFDDPVFSDLVRGTAQALAEYDKSLVLIIAGTPAEQARAANYLTAGHVDGVLLAFSSHGGNPLIDELLAARVPVVSAGQPVGYEGRLGSVSADDFEGAKRMVEYLVSKGRRQIALIAGPQDTPGGINRLAGYRAALGTSNDQLIVYGDYGRESGVRALEELLHRRVDFDAVFAANDAMAVGAISALRDAGLEVPTRVAVAGFDDSVFATSSEPQLTTMRQPFDRISSELVRLLLSVIDGDEPATITLRATLVERDST